MQHILVTGANGFIGQHLVKRLVGEGARVRGTSPAGAAVEFFDSESIEWHALDLCKKETFTGVASGISTVFHLAAIPRNDQSKSWDDFARVNIEGTRFLLEECARGGIKRFVYISTVEAAGYGDGINPRRESDEPHPDNNYGKSKLEAEKIVLNKSWPFECVVVRLPMIYGPGTMLIVPKLFGMVKKGFYPLIGSGDTLMEFCYVENAVEAITLAGSHAAAPGELFYISDERSYSIKEVVLTIAACMNKRVLLLHIPRWSALALGLFWEMLAKVAPIPPIISSVSRKPFFTRETVYWTTSNINFITTQKIRSVLGYEPVKSIQQGVTETWSWLKDRLASK